eukprot:6710096-Pyramimonas_sp.AAC.1
MKRIRGSPGNTTGPLTTQLKRAHLQISYPYINKQRCWASCHQPSTSLCNGSQQTMTTRPFTLPT